MFNGASYYSRGGRGLSSGSRCGLSILCIASDVVISCVECLADSVMVNCIPDSSRGGCGLLSVPSSLVDSGCGLSSLLCGISQVGGVGNGCGLSQVGGSSLMYI